MKNVLVVVALVSVLWGCVTFSASYKLGNKAEMNRDWDKAIALYEKAVLENPREPIYRMALERAKTSASLYLLRDARQLAQEGKVREALVAYDKALLFDPLNIIILQERRRVAAGPIKEEKPAEDKIEPPVKLAVKEDGLVLNFPVETPLRSLFLTLGKTAGINILFDENFRDVPFAINLANVSFEQALSALTSATKNFYRIIDAKTVIIVPDLPMKRLQYELNVIKTFYLSNIKAEEVLQPLMQALSSTFKAVKVFGDKNLNVITIRDTPETAALAGRLLRIWDKPKSEVIIDLSLMEVSRVKMRDLGIDFDQNILGLRYGTPPADADQDTAATSWTSIQGLKLGDLDNYSISLPVAYLSFLQTDADTRILAQPRLRGISDAEIKTLVGQKVPIPRTTFTPIAAGGLNVQPTTSFEYENVGIDIKMTPRVHLEGDVTLELEMKVTSLGGTGYADIPILLTREVKNVLRLKDGETNLLAGLLRDEERTSLRGIPGVASIPLIGRLFGHEVTTVEQSDVIMTITPHIIRKRSLTEEDTKPLWIDIKESPPLGEEEMPVPEEVLEEEAIMERRVREQEAGRAAGANQLSFTPSNFEVPKGREFRITVNLRCSQPVGNFSATISFNGQVVKLKDVQPGSVLRQMGGDVPFLKNFDSASGTCTIGFTSPDMSRGFQGAGPVAVLQLEAASPGESTISASSVVANGPRGQALTFEVRNGRVAVR